MGEILWHSLGPKTVLQQLETQPEGLSEEEVRTRQIRYGGNEPVQQEPAKQWEVFWRQLDSPLIYLLVIAAIISLLLSKVLDAGVIIAIVIINTLIGYWQESKAEKSLQALKKLLSLKTMIYRDGEKQEISAIDLVPGDMVGLETGSKVPADLYLLEAENLKIDESTLTGESIAVHKHLKILPAKTVLADRINLAFASTVVTSGRGLGVVTAIGGKTEIGQIAKEVSQTEEEKTPLHRKLERFGRILLYLTIGLAIFIFLVGLIKGFAAVDIFLISVAAAVAILPEGLPAVITIALAYGVYIMAKNRALVKRMQAVETLGSITLIASDKTGTLTYNQMSADCLILATGQELKISGKGYEPEGQFYQGKKIIQPLKNHLLRKILQIGILSNNSNLVDKNHQWLIEGDPTEGALVVLAAKAGLHKNHLEKMFSRIDELPFSSENQLMATLHCSNRSDKNLLAVKGTIEKILSLASHYHDGKKIRKLSASQKKRILAQAHQKSLEAYRTLALAYQMLPRNSGAISWEKLQGLIYLGYVAMEDPPRADALTAVKKCIKAGIRAIMITGDHPATALAIGKKIGLAQDESGVISGEELSKMKFADFRTIINRANIFARVTPALKLKIIQTLQEQGQIAAVTGDGVNDAPVLKKADVGIAMGIGGTDVAREAADIVLLDNSFATIITAIEEGRAIFLNIRRVVFFLLSTNFGEILVLISSLLLGLPLPLTAVQILWINLITDSTGALALVLEPKHSEVASHPPRSPQEGILIKENYQRIFLVAITMTVVTLGFYLEELSAGASLEKARSTAFITMAVFQIYNLFNSRSLKTSIFKTKVFSNRWLVRSILLCFGLTIITTQTSFMRQLFDTVSLDFSQWWKIILAGLVIIVVVEIDKWIRKIISAKNQLK